MLVKYSLKSFRSGQLIQGEIYLVIEIYIDFEREKTSYRIVSNTGCPAIYEANGFEIVSGKKIAKVLLEIGAVFLRPDKPFIWASGIKSLFRRE